MIYTVRINEYQRQLLIKALKHTNRLEFNSVKKGDLYSSELEELNSFEQTLKDLKDAEEDNPGSIHGLCF